MLKHTLELNISIIEILHIIIAELFYSNLDHLII